MDELSVKTFVSYFPAAKLKPGAPLQSWAHPATTDSAKTPALEPKDLDMIRNSEGKYSPPIYNPTSGKTPKVEPKDLDAIPKEESKSDSTTETWRGA